MVASRIHAWSLALSVLALVTLAVMTLYRGAVWPPSRYALPATVVVLAGGQVLAVRVAGATRFTRFQWGAFTNNPNMVAASLRGNGHGLRGAPRPRPAYWLWALLVGAGLFVAGALLMPSRGVAALAGLGYIGVAVASLGMGLSLHPWICAAAAQAGLRSGDAGADASIHG